VPKLVVRVVLSLALIIATFALVVVVKLLMGRFILLFEKVSKTFAFWVHVYGLGFGFRLCLRFGFFRFTV